MVELTKTKLTSIILAILTALGGTTYYTSEMMVNEDLVSYYVCDLLKEPVQKFDRLSGSGERGYPTIGTTKGYMDCKDELGTRQQWVKLKDYAELVGLDPYSILEVKGNLTPKEIDNFKIIVSPGKEGVTMNQIYIDYNRIREGMPDFELHYESVKS